MANIGLSALSLLFMQSEWFLSHQRGLEEGRKTPNCRTLFGRACEGPRPAALGGVASGGMAAIPTDNHVRAMLDPVDPSHLQPAFDEVLDVLHPAQAGPLACVALKRTLINSKPPPDIEARITA